MTATQHCQTGNHLGCIHSRIHPIVKGTCECACHAMTTSEWVEFMYPPVASVPGSTEIVSDYEQTEHMSHWEAARDAWLAVSEPAEQRPASQPRGFKRLWRDPAARAQVIAAGGCVAGMLIVWTGAMAIVTVLPGMSA